jgi:hypothetical protein
MSQTSLWQTNQQNNDFAEICNALYERELRVLANSDFTSAQSLQARLKSLTYYINRTAYLMTQVKTQGISPLTLDIQNASWSAKQATQLSLSGQTDQDIYSWYLTHKLPLGLVVPILQGEHVILDSIDRVDSNNKQLRTNASGWFEFVIEGSVIKANSTTYSTNASVLKLLKPNKKVMLAACTGHCWQNTVNAKSNRIKLRPSILSLRELLLSCAINWKDFKQPLAL